eukprot:g49699.t1
MLDNTLLSGDWGTPGEVKELLLLPHAAPIALAPYLVPELAKIVCSYFGPAVCYDPMLDRTLRWHFPLHEHAHWTIIHSEEALSLYNDRVFKEAAAADWLKRCCTWNYDVNVSVLQSIVAPTGFESDILIRYIDMYWTFVELRVNACLKAVFEHVAYRLNSVFSIPQGPPPSNEWPFLVQPEQLVRTMTCALGATCQNHDMSTVILHYTLRVMVLTGATGATCQNTHIFTVTTHYTIRVMVLTEKTYFSPKHARSEHNYPTNFYMNKIAVSDMQKMHVLAEEKQQNRLIQCTKLTKVANVQAAIMTAGTSVRSHLHTHLHAVINNRHVSDTPKQKHVLAEGKRYNELYTLYSMLISLREQMLKVRSVIENALTLPIIASLSLEGYVTFQAGN